MSLLSRMRRIFWHDAPLEIAEPCPHASHYGECGICPPWRVPDPRAPAPESVLPARSTLRAIVSQVTIRKRGEISVVVRFDIDERERAQKLTPGQIVEIV